jgi:hypothetical protein
MTCFSHLYEKEEVKLKPLPSGARLRIRRILDFFQPKNRFLYFSKSSIFDVILSLFFPLLFVWVNRDGVTLYSDAGTYAACAESLLEKGELLGKNGAPYYLFPPFFPILLALSLLLTQLPMFLAALYLQAAALWLLSWSLIRLYGQNWIEKTAIILSIVASPVLFKIYIHAFSETVFMALCFFSILIFEKNKNRKKNFYFVLFALLSSLLPLTRYIGIAFVGAVQMYFLGRKAYKKALIFSILSLTPLLFWLLRNYFTYGVVTGGHGRFWHFPWDVKVAETILGILGQWLLPIHLKVESAEKMTLISVLIGIFFLITSISVTFISLFLENDKKQNFAMILKNSLSKIFVEVGYVFFYLLLIFILIRLDRYPYYFERLLFPLYPFFGLLLLKSVSAGADLLEKGNLRYGRWAGVSLYLLLFFWILLQFRRTLTHISIRYFDGKGFSISDFLVQIGDFF